jgi:hypothetical protein
MYLGLANTDFMCKFLGAHTQDGVGTLRRGQDKCRIKSHLNVATPNVESYTRAVKNG